MRCSQSSGHRVSLISVGYIKADSPQSRRAIKTNSNGFLCVLCGEHSCFDLQSFELHAVAKNFSIIYRTARTSVPGVSSDLYHTAKVQDANLKRGGKFQERLIQIDRILGIRWCSRDRGCLPRSRHCCFTGSLCHPNRLCF